MCVPAGLLAITTAVVLYANMTKRAQNFMSTDNVHFLAMQ